MRVPSFCCEAILLVSCTPQAVEQGKMEPPQGSAFHDVHNASDFSTLLLLSRYPNKVCNQHRL